MRNEPAYPVESVGNALRLALILRAEAEVRVTPVASRLGVAPSTAHRLLAMLCQHGFAVREHGGRYRTGPALTGPPGPLGPAGPARTDPAARRAELVAIAQPHLDELRRELDETVHLVVRQGTSIRFIGVSEATAALRVGSRLGMELPAHATSGGKALLARLGRGDLDALYPHGLPHGYGPAVSELPSLRRELAGVRRRGYAVNHEESERGIVGIGAAIEEAGRPPRAALAVGAPTVRCPAARMHVIGRAVVATTALITAALAVGQTG